MRPGERALLDGQVVDDVEAMDVDLRVGEGVEPAAVELETGSFPLPARSTRCLEDDRAVEYLPEAAEVGR